MLRFVLCRAFVLWWCAAVTGWMLVVQAGWDRSAEVPARIVTTLAPLWAMPWHGPLVVLRELGVGGSADALAFLVGLLGGTLVDRVRARGLTRVPGRRTAPRRPFATRPPLRLVRPPSLTPPP